MVERLKKNCFFILVFLFFYPSLTKAGVSSISSSLTRWINQGGVYAESGEGKPLVDYQGKTSFVPASTLKLTTALAALEILGKDYHFKTEFYVDKNNVLYVKGYGDPYLVSEELDEISGILKNRGIKQVKGIILDESYFEEIKVPGVSASLNPYDALNSALSANFNTVFILKTKSGKIESAEAQTPLTELTQKLAKKAPLGKSRINLAAHPAESLLYVGYLLRAFLEIQGVDVSGFIRKGQVSEDAKLVYRHSSSKNLEQVVQAMLKYSTNFIANQLFLILGAEKYGAPANLSKGKKVVTDFLKTRLDLEGFNIEEGSGISRQNKMTPFQLVKVLRAFEKYKGLLPEKLNGILAKTGTLNGVSCLAGYFNSPKYHEVRFVILLNQEGAYREKIAKFLYENLQE